MMAFRLVPLLLLVAASPASAKWSFDEAFMPDWVSLTLKHRTRYELLDDPFRPANAGQSSTDVVAQRTLLHARISLPAGFRVGAELEDSRTFLNSDTVLNSAIVNPFELLQAYVEYAREEFEDGALLARAGRITMDVGSRRLVARNRFRNTINGFTGLDVDWQGKSGLRLRAFATLPVQREPNPQSSSSKRDRYRDNDVVFDTERFDVAFWGLYVAKDLNPSVTEGGLMGPLRGELYVFGLHESDSPHRPTRNRQLGTPGFRVFARPAKGKLDANVEAAIQFGQSRSSLSSTRELDHFAWFVHGAVAYTFEAPASPRLAFEIDYASGDGDPDDGSNNRFDTLYGARRFDFNPTGIYGPFARANLITPGLRLQVKPTSSLSSFVSARTFWLASKSDAWTTTGIIDPQGSSGNHLGTQIEIRVRWDVAPQNVRLEAGYAHTFWGEFIDNAPGSNRQGDSDYFYTQASFSF
jgi:hypothetical protein